MSDTEMLLPCPFCGGSDAFVERLDYSSAFVQCDSRVDEHSVCMARGPVAVQDDDGEEVPGKAGAIREWNRRAGVLPVAAANSAVVAPSIDQCDYDEDDAEDEPCSNCHGDGMDPWDDYCTPCHQCQGQV